MQWYLCVKKLCISSACSSPGLLNNKAYFSVIYCLYLSSTSVYWQSISRWHYAIVREGLAQGWYMVYNKHLRESSNLHTPHYNYDKRQTNCLLWHSDLTNYCIACLVPMYQMWLRWEFLWVGLKKRHYINFQIEGMNGKRSSQHDSVGDKYWIYLLFIWYFVPNYVVCFSGNTYIGLLQTCLTIYNRQMDCFTPSDIQPEWLLTFMFIASGIICVTITIVMLSLSYWKYDVMKYARWLGFIASKICISVHVLICKWTGVGIRNVVSGEESVV